MRTATVAYVNDDNTFDLLYSSSSSADGLSSSTATDEEDNVPIQRLTLVVDDGGNEQKDSMGGSSSISSSSEADTTTNEDRIRQAERLKSEAGVLFQLKDFEAANEKYKESIASLGSIKPCVGSTVLVREKGKREFACQYVPALISIVDEEKKVVDVMYTRRKKLSTSSKKYMTQNEEEEEEEDDVSMERIHVLPRQTLESTAPLQCTLHLNCAVCNLKLKRFTLAIGHASLAVGIAKYSHSKESATGIAKKTGDHATASVNVWVKGFWIRGKAQVALNHFKEARADAKKILLLPGEEENVKALSLLKLIEKRQILVKKKDQALVKSMSTYIGVAMERTGGGGMDDYDEELYVGGGRGGRGGRGGGGRGGRGGRGGGGGKSGEGSAGGKSGEGSVGRYSHK